MKRGDKWNWAFITTALMQGAMYLCLQNVQARFAHVGGYHHNASIGIALLGWPLLIAPVALAASGAATFFGKSVSPLLGVAIGIGL